MGNRRRWLRSTLAAERGRRLSALRSLCSLVKQTYRGRITSVTKAKPTPATPAPVRQPLGAARINKAGTPASEPGCKLLGAAQGHAIDEADRRGRLSDTIPRPIRAA